MVETEFSPQQYEQLTLKALADQLHINYYNILSSMSEQAASLLQELQSADKTQNTLAYAEICKKALSQINVHIYGSRLELLPYLKLHKPERGSDTGYYSYDRGSSRLRSYFTQLHDSQKELRQLFYELQVVALPLYSKLRYPKVYKLLRNKMLLIDTILRELFLLEEGDLIPKMLQLEND